MSNTFQLTQSLPERGVTRQKIYDLIRSILPTTELVDDVSIQVTGNKLTLKNAVPFWRKYTVTHAQWQAAAASGTVDLFTLPPGGIVHAVKIKHSTQFVGTGLTDYKVSVGITGNATKYAAAYDVDTAVGDGVFQLSTTVGGESHASAGTAIKATATCTGDTLDKSTAGSVDIWVLWSVAV